MRFTRQEHMDRHAQRHSGSRPFACGLCDKSFPRRYPHLAPRPHHGRVRVRLLTVPFLCPGIR
jgi:uncharacterized Zn-finger protein